MGEKVLYSIDKFCLSLWLIMQVFTHFVHEQRYIDEVYQTNDEDAYHYNTNGQEHFDIVYLPDDIIMQDYANNTPE